MPKLTAEITKSSLAFVNPLKQIELDLRGNKIPQIENLGATEVRSETSETEKGYHDQFEVIDLSDNLISKLENIPYLTHLNVLFLHNNKISRIAKNLGASMPNLNTLTLTNNKLTEFSDIEPLGDIPSLTILSIMDNPVRLKPNCRLFLISILPNLRILDFLKIKKHERQSALQLFQSSQGNLIHANLQLTQEFKNNTFVPGEGIQPEKDHRPTLSLVERQLIRQAILNASSNEELNQLEEALRTNKMPKHLIANVNSTDSGTTSITSHEYISPMDKSEGNNLERIELDK